MTTFRKIITGPVEFKASGNGQFRARFATLNAVDLDGDVTLPGAFPVGKSVPISAYGHKSWEGALPVGVGTIGADGSKAWIDGKFFLDTQPGRDTYNALKGLVAEGVGSEWSYGFDILDASFEVDGFPVGTKRVLKSLDVFEVSPVLRGAGIDTAVEYIKSAGFEMHGSPETIRHLELVDERMAQLDEAVDALMLHLGEEDAEGEGSAEELGSDNLPFRPPKSGEIDLEAMRDRLILTETKQAIEAADELINPPIAYVEISGRQIHSEQGRVARETLRFAAADLGLDRVKLRWFREAGEGEAFTFKSSPILGRAFKGDVWVRADQYGESLAEVVLHEAFHIAHPTASEEQVELAAIKGQLRTKWLRRTA